MKVISTGNCPDLSQPTLPEPAYASLQNLFLAAAASCTVSWNRRIQDKPGNITSSKTARLVPGKQKAHAPPMLQPSSPTLTSDQTEASLICFWQRREKRGGRGKSGDALVAGMLRWHFLQSCFQRFKAESRRRATPLSSSLEDPRAQESNS